MFDLANELDKIGKRSSLLGITAEEFQKLAIMAKGIIATNEQVKQAEEFNDAWVDFSNTAKSLVIPTLVKMMEVTTAMMKNDFSSLYEDNIDFYRKLTAEEKKAGARQVEIRNRLKKIGDILESNNRAIEAYQNAMDIADKKQQKILQKMIADLRAENKKLNDEIKQLKGEKDKPISKPKDEIIGPSKETQRLLDKYKRQLTELEIFRKDRLAIIEAYDRKEITLEQKKQALLELSRRKQAYLDRTKPKPKPKPILGADMPTEDRALISQQLFDRYATDEMKKKADIAALEQDLKKLNSMFQSGDLKVSTQEYLDMVNQINKKIVELNTHASEFGQIMSRNAEQIGIEFGRALGGMKVSWEALAAQILADLVQMAIMAQLKDTPFAFVAPLVGGTIRGFGQSFQQGGTVNVYNNSGVPQKVLTETQYDGKEYVTNIIIEDNADSIQSDSENINEADPI